MEQLTQEEAERCARACWGEPRDFILKEAMTGGPPRDSGKRIKVYDVSDSLIYRIEEMPKGHWTRDTWELRSLPLDPYFWRPRLEDRFLELAKDRCGDEFDHAGWFYDDKEMWVITLFTHRGFHKVFGMGCENKKSIEAALCEAIEKLIEVQIRSKSGQEKGKLKFTLGPLTIKRSLSPDNTGGYDYGIIDKGNQIIAETYEHVDEGKELGAIYDKRPAMANAYLYAAAPELYEALEKMVKATKNWNTAIKEIIGRQPETIIDLETAKAALAKARGE